MHSLVDMEWDYEIVVFYSLVSWIYLLLRLGFEASTIGELL